MKQNGIVMKYEEIEGGKEYRTPWNGVTYAFLSRVTYAFVVCGVTYTFLFEVTFTFVCIRRVNMKVSDDLPDKEEYYDNDSYNDSDNDSNNDNDNDSDNNNDNANDNYQIPYFSHIAICRFRVNSCCKQFKRRVGI